MRLYILSTLTALLMASFVAVCTAHEADDPSGLKKPEFKNLMSSVLKGANGLEVILSHVALPPNVTLPKHWHPGEEFAYILEGSVTLILDGENEKVISKGEAGVVPLKRIHTARTGDDGAIILVFRVHAQGQPGRVLVDE